MSKHRKEGPVTVTHQTAVFPEFELYPVAFTNGRTQQFGELSGLDEDHMRTIHFALEHYAEALRKDLKKAEDSEHRYEEEMFLNEQLYRIASIQFAIHKNHPPELVKAIGEWLGV